MTTLGHNPAACHHHLKIKEKDREQHRVCVCQLYAEQRWLNKMNAIVPENQVLSLAVSQIHTFLSAAVLW